MLAWTRSRLLLFRVDAGGLIPSKPGLTWDEVLKELKQYRKLSLWWLLAGLALFVYLIYKTGVGNVIAGVQLFGAGFLLLLIISGVRHVLRTVAWYYSIEQKHRRVSFVDLFKMRLIGEAISDLTFAGPVLGETAKTLAASTRMPLTFSLSSVVIENLIYGLAVIAFVVSGVLVLLWRIALPQHLRIASIVGGLALLVPVLVVYLLVSRRWLAITALLNWVKRTNRNWTFLTRREQRLRLFEENVYGFYGRHRRLFWGITVLEILANLTGVFEAYLILGKTWGYYSWLMGYLLEWANRVVNLAFAFVPLRVGVDEGSTALTMDGLGYDPATGVTLAVIRKIRTLFWVGVGLIITAQYSFAPDLRASGLSAGEDPME